MKLYFLALKLWGFITDKGVLASATGFGISLTQWDLIIKVLFGAPLFLIGCIRLYKEIKKLRKPHPQLTERISEMQQDALKEKALKNQNGNISKDYEKDLE